MLSIMLALVLVLENSSATRDGAQDYLTVDDPAVQRMRIICGPNSLYMLLRGWNVAVDYTDMEQRLHMSNRGASLLSLQQTAKYFGLPTRARKCTIQSLRTLNVPSIVHLRSGLYVGDPGDHYVVLLSISDDGVAIIDGTTGLREGITLGKLQSVFTGYVLEPIPKRFVFESSLAPFPVLLAVILLGWGLLARTRRQKQMAATMVLVGMSACSLAPLANAGQPVQATDDDGFWRTSHDDAVNSLDLYLRLVGHPTSRHRIIAALGGAGRQASLSDLSRASRMLGQPLRVVRSSPDRLNAMPKPVIVHLYEDAEQHGGYSLLFQVRKNEYRLINTAYAVLDLVSTDDFRRRWSGYALVADNGNDSWWRSAGVGLCVLAAYVWLRFRKPRTTDGQTVEGAGIGQQSSA